MTVTAQPSKFTYVGNGVTVDFAYPAPVSSENYLGVYVIIDGAGDETPLTIGADYSVNVSNDNSNATVTFVNPPANDAEVVLLRKTPAEQKREFGDTEYIDLEQHERAHDDAALRDQELEDEISQVLKPTGVGSASPFDAGGRRVRNVADPVDDQDLVTFGSSKATLAATEAARDAAQGAEANVQTNAAAANQAKLDAQAARDTAQGYRDEAEADKNQTAADRVATGQDRTATAADVVVTNADAAQTTSDKASTTADRVAAETAAATAVANAVLTDADRVAADSARVAAEAARDTTQGYRDEADVDRIAAEAAKAAAEQAATDAQNIANGSAFVQKANNGSDFADPAATLNSLVGNAEAVELNRYGVGDRIGYLDFHAKNGSDFDFRIIRYAGENGGAEILHLGTGNFYIGSNDDAPVILKQNGDNKFTVQSDGNLVASAPLLAVRADFDAGILTADANAYLQVVAKGAIGQSMFELWTDPAHTNRAWQMKSQTDGHLSMYSYNNGWSQAAQFRADGKLQLFGTAGGWGAEAALQLIASSDPGISFYNTVSGRNINLILYNGPTAELAVAGGYLGNNVWPLWHKGNLKVWSYTFSPIGGGYYALAHGMGIMPRMLQLKLVCTTAIHGFGVGQEHYIPIHWSSQDGNSKGVTAWQDSTNIYLRFGTDANWLPIINTSGAFADITATELANNFDLVLETLAW